MTRSVPGQGPRGWEFRAGRRGGVQSPEPSECPVGERVGHWGMEGLLDTVPEACHIGRNHAALVAPLAVGGLSLPPLP